MTSYQRHANLEGHDLTREAIPVSEMIGDHHVVETCSECDQQFLLGRDDGGSRYQMYTASLRSRDFAKLRR